MGAKLNKVVKVVGLVSLAWLIVRSWHPKWYDDLMLRAFAKDQLADPGKSAEEKAKFEQAADIAARSLMPIGWVIRIAEVTTGTTLEQAVQKVKSQVLAMGPPADTQPDTLAAYKATALGSVGVKG